MKHKRLEDAAKFIAPWEGFRSCPYQDSGGVWTIGFGETENIGPSTPCITVVQGKQLLATRLGEFARAMDRLVKVPLTRRQEMAVISFAYNVGIGGLEESSFLKYLNQGKYKKASNRLLLWVKDDRGTTLLGLLRRRRAERWLMRHPKK